MDCPDLPPSRARTDVLLERVVLGIVLFLAVTSLVVRVWLVTR